MLRGPILFGVLFIWIFLSDEVYPPILMAAAVIMVGIVNYPAILIPNVSSVNLNFIANCHRHAVGSFQIMSYQDSVAGMPVARSFSEGGNFNNKSLMVEGYVIVRQDFYHLTLEGQRCIRKTVAKSIFDIHCF